jgi:hypothetical protein
VIKFECAGWVKPGTLQNVWLGEVQNISGKLMFIPPKIQYYYIYIILYFIVIIFCIMIIIIVMDFNSSPCVFEPGNPSYSKNSTVKPSVKLPSLLLLGLRCAGISMSHVLQSSVLGFNVQLPSFDWLHLEMICPTLFVMRISLEPYNDVSRNHMAVRSRGAPDWWRDHTFMGWLGAGRRKTVLKGVAD